MFQQYLTRYIDNFSWSGSYLIEPFVYIAIVLNIIGVVSLIFLCLKLYRKGRKNLIFFFGLIFLYFVSIFLDIAPQLTGFTFFGISLFPLTFLPSLLREIIPLIIGLWLFKLLTNNTKNNIPTNDDVDDWLRNFFKSDKFLLAANQVLPKHEEDTKYGLDWIPWVLENIEQKRNRYLRSANTFLGLTIIVGVLFSGVLIFYGYMVLLNKYRYRYDGLFQSGEYAP